MSIDTIIYPVSDLEAAKKVFTAALGSEPTHDFPYYVGYELGDQQLGLNPQGAQQGMTGPVPYVHVADIHATRQAMIDAGATAGDEPQDVGGGRLTAILTDADGNQVGLLQDT